MKILMVSIFAPHFFNWTEQLRNSGHEVYWLDVFDSNTPVKKIDFAQQITGWRYRWDHPGRYFLKRNVPGLTRLINRFNERDLQEVLTAKLQEIRPHVVHSFVMYLAAAPILDVMRKFPQIKWIYSSWGSDLFYYRNREKELEDMKKTLPELDFMFADCQRDYKIALENGLRGEFLGVFPGGGGFDFRKTDPHMKSLDTRDLILIKGYQGLHGRCISVLEALCQLEEKLGPYRIVVYGAREEVMKFIANSKLAGWEKFQVLSTIPHAEVIKLMGQALIHIGNSLSDGTPNTLLEAIVMGAFPVQSDPGGATAEWIEDGKNGALIRDPESVKSIAELLKDLLSQKKYIRKGATYNLEFLKSTLNRDVIREEVLSRYAYIEESLKHTPVAYEKRD